MAQFGINVIEDKAPKISIGRTRSRWSKEIDKRQKRLQSMCSTNTDPFFDPVNLRQFQYNRKHRMFYCGVEKIGSTFWRRLLQQIDKGVIQSPYDIRPENGLLNSRNLENITSDELDDILRFSVKFLFVRDPYSRLLSGYIDKLYSPNIYFWNEVGERIVRNFRPNATMKSKTCGHDVTFSEFIQYVIEAEKTGINRDSHFTSVVRLCNPCNAKFDIVGKMETFDDDTRYILETFGLRQYLSVIDSASNSKFYDDSIYDAAQAFVSMRSDFRQCLDVYKALLRVWEKLQIKGIISLNMPCPVKRDDSFSITVPQLISVFKGAHEQSSRQALFSQKRSLFIKAYNQIPYDILKAFGHAFKEDFDLFGYEQFPDSLFRRTDDQ